MPQLSFTGVKVEEIKTIGSALTDVLARIAEAPRDYFSYEVLEHPFIFDGEIVPYTPVVEVKWFDRGQVVKDQMAVVIDQAVRSLGYDHIEIIFEALRQESYYENGVHY